MLLDWSPTCDTHPQTTSSTIAGSMPVRSTSSQRTTAERSAGCIPDSPPLRLPTGVRTASTITASRIFPLPSGHRPPTRERRRALFGERGVRLRGVGGREIHSLRAGLIGQRIFHCAVGALVQQRFGLRESDR